MLPMVRSLRARNTNKFKTAQCLILIILIFQAIIVVLVASFLLAERLPEISVRANIKTIAKLQGSVNLCESLEPPVQAQRVKPSDPTVVYSESRLHKKLWDQLKGIVTHLMYLGL